MSRTLRQRVVLVLLTALIVAVLALAVAQSVHLQPLLPALITVLILACVVSDATGTRRGPDTASQRRSLPQSILPVRFQLPPPITIAA